MENSWWLVTYATDTGEYMWRVQASDAHEAIHEMQSVIDPQLDYNPDYRILKVVEDK